jgi:hypothetical protein
MELKLIFLMYMLCRLLQKYAMSRLYRYWWRMELMLVFLMDMFCRLLQSGAMRMLSRYWWRRGLVLRYLVEMLCEVLQRGHEKVIQLLVEHGADVNVSDGYALRSAAEMGHEKLVQPLLEQEPMQILLSGGYPLRSAAGTYPPFIPRLSGKATRRDTSTKQALAIAAARGYERIVHLLLENGADIHGSDGDALVCC